MKISIFDNEQIPINEGKFISIYPDVQQLKRELQARIGSINSPVNLRVYFGRRPFPEVLRSDNFSLESRGKIAEVYKTVIRIIAPVFGFAEGVFVPGSTPQIVYINIPRIARVEKLLSGIRGEKLNLKERVVRVYLHETDHVKQWLLQKSQVIRDTLANYCFGIVGAVVAPYTVYELLIKNKNLLSTALSTAIGVSSLLISIFMSGIISFGTYYLIFSKIEKDSRRVMRNPDLIR